MPQIAIIHGPNLNLLGNREPEHYGTRTLDALNDQMKQQATQLNLKLTFFQSNHEGSLIDHIQECRTAGVEFIIFNPAAFTHTSIALRDALLATQIPFVEIHLSNVFRRESFRHHSYFSDIAVGVISGLGPDGYLLALSYASRHLTNCLNHRSHESLWTCEKSEN